MLVNYSFDTADIANASHSVTLVPRLDYSVNLLDDIIDTLQEKRIELKTINRYLVTDFDIDDQSHVGSVIKAVIYELDTTATDGVMFLNESDNYTLQGNDLGSWDSYISTILEPRYFLSMTTSYKYCSNQSSDIM